MNWMEALYRTYENNTDHIGDPNDKIPLLPLHHNLQQIQVQVVLNGEGNFLRAEVVSKEQASTIIPTTEESAGRTGTGMAPHPLFDTLQYVAKDYLSWGGNPKKEKDKSGYEEYIAGLESWVQWSNNPKLRSVLLYLRKGCVIKDLVEYKILFADEEGRLLEKWETRERPAIFNAIKQSKRKGQYDVFVCFSVEIPPIEQSELWLDKEIQESWINYCATQEKFHELCFVLGKWRSITRNHPKSIRYPGDKTKLISSNDTKGFTYRGRFTYAEEACCVSTEVTQKAHSALRWLIYRQGQKNKNGLRDQVFVAWAVSGVDIPSLFVDTLSLVLDGEEKTLPEKHGYTAQEVGNAFAKKIAGYAANLKITDRIIVLGVNSALENGNGGLAITFCRELAGSELLERVEKWHAQCSWWQYLDKDTVFVGAPAPRDIAEVAYGTWRGKRNKDDKAEIKDKLCGATIERLLPCIIDNTKLPRDIVEACVRRTSNRQSFPFKKTPQKGFFSWQWEKALGVTCALYRYQYKERNYAMSLDKKRKTRDYLYGRLLALADHLEKKALFLADENRETNAGKLMQRFEERPYSTWSIIELALTPYKARLRTKCPKFLYFTETELHEIHALFDEDDYVSDKRLSGEFLLGYHCQLHELRMKPDKSKKAADNTENSAQEQ